MIDFKRASRNMVDKYVAARGIKNQRVLDAMAEVPRHIFVEEALQGQAYGDNALPIGDGQSISQPYIVARMTESLGLEGGERVLEVGGGSGYQTAILSRLAGEVFSVERLASLAGRARRALFELKCRNVLYKVADGTMGWKDKAPFDVILVAAASPTPPEELLSQLKDGGRLVIPMNAADGQRLIRYIKSGDSFIKDDIGECNFVPLIGKQGWKESEINA